MASINRFKNYQFMNAPEGERRMSARATQSEIGALRRRKGDGMSRNEKRKQTEIACRLRSPSFLPFNFGETIAAIAGADASGA